MKLLTKEIRKRLPKLRAQATVKDPIVYVKFFNPTGSGTWLATEGEPVLDEDGKEVDFHFFGYVMGLGHDELGTFSLNELQSVKGRFGLGIEREMYESPMPLSKYKERGF